MGVESLFLEENQDPRLGFGVPILNGDNDGSYALVAPLPLAPTKCQVRDSYHLPQVSSTASRS